MVVSDDNSGESKSGSRRDLERLWRFVISRDNRSCALVDWEILINKYTDRWLARKFGDEG